jgi:hypothetical protein
VETARFPDTDNPVYQALGSLAMIEHCNCGSIAHRQKRLPFGRVYSLYQQNCAGDLEPICGIEGESFGDSENPSVSACYLGRMVYKK